MMIKNSIKKLVTVGLFVGVGLSAVTLETFNQAIAISKHPDQKQMIICEREATLIMKNPQECLKAADMLLESKKNLKAGYRFEFSSGMSSDYAKAYEPKIYAQTDKEFVDSSLASAYYNAGIIYKALGQHKARIKMYKKALEYNPNDESVHYGLGAAYYYGEGVELNKIKSYEHFKIAARQGHVGAQKDLDTLCRQSPWACK